jgi:signal peptidase II
MLDLRLKAYGAAAAVFAIDRFTKWIVETRVSFIDTYRVIPGFFDIVHSQNRGVAFGLFNDGVSEWRTPLLLLFSLAAVVIVAVILWNADRLDRLSLAGFALILGGAAGNVFDRLVWGRVTDFLEFYVGDYHWPTFNIADSAIVIGSGLLLIELLRPKRQVANVP